MAAEFEFVLIIISLSVLLFSAKILAEIFHRINQPVVLGELLAGIIVGPFALGDLPLFDGKPLVILDNTIKHIGELAVVIILFIVGLEITPREFLRGGVASFTVGALRVALPFFLCFVILSLYGMNSFEILLVATALTATSIAISIQVLTELGKMQSKEARLILGAAIVDDILAIAILSVVTTMVQTHNISPDAVSIAFLILKILGLFAVLLVSAVFVIPRILHTEKLWRSRGSLEGITTAIFFGVAGLTAYIGLSPIVGAFAAGMAVASTRLIKQVDVYAQKLQFILLLCFLRLLELKYTCEEST